MGKLEMEGPYSLDSDTIDKKVKKNSAGNYALGFTEERKNETVFIVKYVGRSDGDPYHLNKRLHDHVNEYKEFKFSYASSPKEAFEKECYNYHDFGGSEKLDNKRHPDRPDGTSLKCPVCGS